MLTSCPLLPAAPGFPGCPRDPCCNEAMQNSNSALHRNHIHTIYHISLTFRSLTLLSTPASRVALSHRLQRRLRLSRA